MPRRPGTGAGVTLAMHQCPTCEGSGFVDVDVEGRHGAVVVSVACPDCDTVGSVPLDPNRNNREHSEPGEAATEANDLWLAEQ